MSDNDYYVNFGIYGEYDSIYKQKRRLNQIKVGEGQGQGGGMNVIISRSYFLKEKTGVGA